MEPTLVKPLESPMRLDRLALGDAKRSPRNERLLDQPLGFEGDFELLAGLMVTFAPSPPVDRRGPPILLCLALLGIRVRRH